jgi:hypothetical protein
MKWIILWILSLLAAACSKPMLRCEGHLTPINAPAKVQSPAERAVPPGAGHESQSPGSHP